MLFPAGRSPLLFAPLLGEGVELMHIWKGCKGMSEKKRQQNPSTTQSPSLPGALATSALPPRAHSEEGGLSLECKGIGDSQPPAPSSACGGEAELFPAARGSILKEPALKLPWNHLALGLCEEPCDSHPSEMWCVVPPALLYPWLNMGPQEYQQEHCKVLA